MERFSEGKRCGLKDVRATENSNSCRENSATAATMADLQLRARLLRPSAKEHARGVGCLACQVSRFHHYFAELAI